MSGHPRHTAHGGGYGAPAAFFSGDPFGADPAGLLHAPRWDDGVSMEATMTVEDLQNEKIERSMERVGFGHTQSSSYIDV